MDRVRNIEILSDSVRQALRAPGDWWQPRLRVGVTGLAGAGKTTFLVSLINQFENIVALDWRRRPGLARIVSARWHEDSDGALTNEVFAYRAALERLTSTPPSWPVSTEGCSTARIDLRAKRGGLIDRFRGDFEATIELVDYPGEWLLDLALLDMDYAHFSQVMLDVLMGSGSPEPARVWAQQLAKLDRSRAMDDGELSRWIRDYQQVLRTLRNPPFQRRRLMPGRLIRGAAAQTAVDWAFVPLPNAEADDPLVRFMRQRFDEYRRKVARPFRRDLFLRLDAQIVLVDLLGALRGGQAALRDTQSALQDLLQSFRHGGQGGLFKGWFPHISHVVFAVTQIDELLPEDQTQAVRILEDLLFDEVQRLRAAGVKVSLRAVAALRSARPFAHPEGPALEGFERESGAAIALLPPRLPEHLPGDLNVRLAPFPRLSPPPGLRRVGGFPNFRMSDVIEDLVADWIEART
ncbi:MAG: YcjX family protein [Thioalkalivibrionaceae bacterium]